MERSGYRGALCCICTAGVARCDTSWAPLACICAGRSRAADIHGMAACNLPAYNVPRTSVIVRGAVQLRDTGVQAAQEAFCVLLRTHIVPMSSQSSQVLPVLETSQQHVVLNQEDCWMPYVVWCGTCVGCALRVEEFWGLLGLPLGSAAVITSTAAGLNRPTRRTLLAASAWCRAVAANTAALSPLVKQRMMYVCVCVLRCLCTGSLQNGCTALGLVYTTDSVQCADSTAAQVPHQGPRNRR